MIEEAKPELRRDPVLAELIDRHELSPLPEYDEFERLCVSVINQQLSTTSATAIRDRVLALFGGAITTRDVLEADEAVLREAGLSSTKVEYVRSAARAFERDDLTRERVTEWSDDEIVDRLTEIHGIGQWTAHMYLLFVLKRPDVLPLGDLAVRRGIQELYGNGSSLTRTEMRDAATQWAPYRSVATRYIWAEYEAAE